MLSAITIGMGAVLLVGFLLLRWLLRIVHEALDEIAREEVEKELRSAIPKVSLGLVRRAAHDLPASESSVVEDWEARLGEEAARPLKMLALAVQLYRNRHALAAEASEPVAEPSESTPGGWSVRQPQIGRDQIASRLSRVMSLSTSIAARWRPASVRQRVRANLKDGRRVLQVLLFDPDTRSWLLPDRKAVLRTVASKALMGSVVLLSGAFLSKVVGPTAVLVPAIVTLVGLLVHALRR
jgi:hypothetical protein